MSIKKHEPGRYCYLNPNALENFGDFIFGRGWLRREPYNLDERARIRHRARVGPIWVTFCRTGTVALRGNFHGGFKYYIMELND